MLKLDYIFIYESLHVKKISNKKVFLDGIKQSYFKSMI